MQVKIMTEKKIYDVIIVGAGAAGMTAALYALRNGKSALVLEKENCGGQIAKSPRVENFPSVARMGGDEFADKLFDQIINLGAEFELANVERVDKKEGVFSVQTDYGVRIGKSIILANGVKQRMTGVKGEDDLIGNGVSYCALCDGAFYKDEEVALIGDANSALQYAVLLSGYCKKVTVVTLFDKFFAEDFLIKKVLSLPNIEVHHNKALTEFVTSGGELSGLKFKDKDGSVFSIDVKAVFIAIGQIPDNSAFANLCDIDKNGYFISDESCATRTDGVFVAGDCRAKNVRQLTTAVADGAVAATAACSYLGRKQ